MQESFENEKDQLINAVFDPVREIFANFQKSMEFASLPPSNRMSLQKYKIYKNFLPQQKHYI